ncbi:MAG: SPOR domain-containing protein [Bacteroidota bacterium]
MKSSRRSLKKKYYSVQLGAFRVLSNADRAKKIAQQRYKKPVYQFYDKPIKMYRVTVGNFSKLKEALKFLKTIRQQHPKEYKDAWVAEMRR